MSEEDCLGAKFEILVDDKTQYCRDTLVTAMGAANIIQVQNPKSRVAVRDLQTGQLTVTASDATTGSAVATPATVSAAMVRAQFEIRIDGMSRSQR